MSYQVAAIISLRDAWMTRETLTCMNDTSTSSHLNTSPAAHRTTIIDLCRKQVGPRPLRQNVTKRDISAGVM